MRKLTILALTGLILTSAALPALAAGPIDVQAGLDLYTKYVWRGKVMTPDPVLQPSVGVGLLGFEAGFWGNMDTSDVNGSEWSFNETRWSLGWSMGLPMIDLGAGLIYYDFSDLGWNTSELYLHAGLNVFLSPYVTFSQDLDKFKGAYWEAGISHNVGIGPTTNLEVGATLGLGSEGYVGGYFGSGSGLTGVPDVPGGASMTDLAVRAAVPFDLALFFTLTPSVAYTTLLGDVKNIVKEGGDGVYHGDTDAVVWGLSASFKF